MKVVDMEVHQIELVLMSHDGLEHSDVVRQLVDTLRIQP
jgi:hypothetical protein